MRPPAFGRPRGRSTATWEVCVTTTHSFTPWQLREIKSQLEEDFARVLTMTNAQGDSTASTSGAWRPESRSESVQLETVLQEGAQDRLSAITAALRRIDTGTYGECARCGNAISFGRLAVMPEATHCVACGAW